MYCEVSDPGELTGEFFLDLRVSFSLGHPRRPLVERRGRTKNSSVVEARGITAVVGAMGRYHRAHLEVLEQNLVHARDRYRARFQRRRLRQPNPQVAFFKRRLSRNSVPAA